MNKPTARWRGRIAAMPVVISCLIVGLGVITARALSHVGEDLQIMYAEYTLAAAELAHVSADILRYRSTIIQALEAPDQRAFERTTADLPAQRARIQNKIDRYAAASLRVSRSGRSEPEDLDAVRRSLEAYFAAASHTINLLIQSWHAKSQREAAALRHQAELHAADNAASKLIQLTLALDRLLETVAEVAKDMQEEGTRTIHRTGVVLTVGSVLTAVLNLLIGWPSHRLAMWPDPQTPASALGGARANGGTIRIPGTRSRPGVLDPRQHPKEPV